ncbi:MAG: hypothetical protein WBE91_15610 [Steroidobacteraceae bacterium]
MITRRRFAASAATLAFLHTADRAAAVTTPAGAAVRGATGPCADRSPPWVARLRTDLERMAQELTARLHPWRGPSRVLTPESFGHRPGAALSTPAIQAAIDAAAQRHVRNLTLDRVRVVATSSDPRPMIETLDTTELCPGAG